MDIRIVPGRGALLLLLSLMRFPAVAQVAGEPDPAVSDVTSSTAGFGDTLFVNSIGMVFVRIEAGRFVMGEETRLQTTFLNNPEQPAHVVHITRPFFLGRYEVTQRQWKEVMGNNPSRFQGLDRPVESVSWFDVQEFVRRLEDREPDSHYRLSTEAEWEYAARAGGSTRYTGTDSVAALCLYANVADREAALAYPDWSWPLPCDDGYAETAPVGRFLPNAWALYDMTGNVWEFVSDWYGRGYYAESPEDDPKGPATGSYHVKRGGSWYDDERFNRLAWRIGDDPPYRRGPVLGFRLVRELTPAP